MAWPIPKYSRNQVNRAGQALCTLLPDTQEYRWATDILNNWRSCHGYPINTFQATLRVKLGKIDSTGIVAQRLKRTPSIVAKLQRFNGMQLSRMQDIGGLRAVVRNLKEVRSLESSYKRSRFKHELVTERDYIANPKSSGYRSVHMIYRYQNATAPAYDGLLLELQIRTRLQHAWATAVETMGTFLDYSLKSSEGPEQWLDFFSLAGSAFAHLEGCAPVPDYAHMNRDQTYAKVLKDAARLNVRTQLEAFAVAVNEITQDEHTGSYHLLVLDPVKKQVHISTYGRGRLDQANHDYTREEFRVRKGESIQVVLVSAGSIDDLRRAYPNYFLDTREFIKQIDRIERAVKMYAKKSHGQRRELKRGRS